jgi:2-methylcitrate dehydratase
MRSCPASKPSDCAPRVATWLAGIARWLASETAELIPDEAWEAASRHVLDAVICAVGGRGHDASQAMLSVLRALNSQGECSVLGEGQGMSPVDAILANGTFIRALDCNDFEVRDGQIYGHPSDNIAAALAFAELAGASGAELLRAVLLGYELYWRLLGRLFRSPAGRHWDHTSVSGMVAAAMGGLLLRLDERKLAAAMSIGGCQSYSLAGLRQSEISSLKASANARTAAAGALGALLARAGVTGPAELLEGKGGLLAALDVEPTTELREAFVEPVGPRWHLLDVSLKPYPAISTSQGVIAAALDVAKNLSPNDVDAAQVRVVDSATNREHMADPARAQPSTRETADHSLPFLVAAALQDGELGTAQFEGERWLRPDTRDLMSRIRVIADRSLNEHAASTYPASVHVTLRSGEQLRCEMLRVPGSPGAPLTLEQLRAKLARISDARLSPATERAFLQLRAAPDARPAARLLRTITSAGRAG